MVFLTAKRIKNLRWVSELSDINAWAPDFSCRGERAAIMGLPAPDQWRKNQKTETLSVGFTVETLAAHWYS